ncbi:unnamed protein product [Cylindrotheca closterium]|uniref:Uncharacterized protein n=1 Tax=Cylindrotheca closterium TaxID=2856 RepID=A0AAD2CPQ7_9STRA|nr:unnamed protein product [Cylindrotheca closterium]
MEGIAAKMLFKESELESTNSLSIACETPMFAEVLEGEMVGYDETEFLRSKKKLFKYKVFDTYDRTLIVMSGFAGLKSVGHSISTEKGNDPIQVGY